jgi:hypothetical protein
MHYRRFVLFLLGLWLGGSLLAAWYGAASFGTVNRMMAEANPGFLSQVKELGPDTTRQVLRAVVVEQNRWLFASWEYGQVVMAALLFAYLLFGTLEGKASLALALVMLALVLLQRIWISPEIAQTAKALPYLPRDLALQERARFWLLHNTYLGIEVIKLGIGAVLGALVATGRRSGDPMNKLNMVDKANHRHVNW